MSQGDISSVCPLAGRWQQLFTTQTGLLWQMKAIIDSKRATFSGEVIFCSKIFFYRIYLTIPHSKTLSTPPGPLWGGLKYAAMIWKEHIALVNEAFFIQLSQDP